MEGVSQFKKETVFFINAIENFFSTHGISYHLQFLKNWINPPQPEFAYQPQNYHANLLGFYEQLVLLFEYSDLIFKCNETDTEFMQTIVADEYSLERETVLLDHYPKLLSNSEMKNPQLTFLDIFIFFKSNSYKIVYKEWLMAKLENKLDLDWDQYVAQFYHNTKKMLEACWLIHERVISKNSFKSIERHQHLALFEGTSPLAFNNELFDNPFTAIEFFFKLDNLAGHKAYLKNWYKTALAEEQRVADVADYFFLYNQFIKLLNAGYLIAAKKLNYKSFTAAEGFLNNDAYNKGLCEVSTLAAVHIENPYLFIEAFFIPEKIKKLRLGLSEWLYAAFSTKNSIKLLETEFLFEQYEAMMMVMEAFFVMIGNPLLGDVESERWHYAV